jgi:hypothetical protein
LTCRKNNCKPACESSAQVQMASAFKLQTLFIMVYSQREYIILPLQIVVADCCDGNHFFMTKYWRCPFWSLLFVAGKKLNGLRRGRRKAGSTAGHHSHLRTSDSSTSDRCSIIPTVTIQVVIRSPCILTKLPTARGLICL